MYNVISKTIINNNLKKINISMKKMIHLNIIKK